MLGKRHGIAADHQYQVSRSAEVDEVTQLMIRSITLAEIIIMFKCSVVFWVFIYVMTIIAVCLKEVLMGCEGITYIQGILC